MNMAILTGKVGYFKPGKIADKEHVSFSVVVSRPYKDKDGNRPADFIPCEAWGKTAEFIKKYFNNKAGIEIVGSFRSDQFTDKDGNTRQKVYCLVDKVEFPKGGLKTEPEATESESSQDPVMMEDGELSNLPFEL